VQEELKKLRDKVLQKKEMDWQTRKEMENCSNARNSCKADGRSQAEFRREQAATAGIQPANEDQQQKQEKLEKLMEETMSKR
jgi:hypothetical protein